MVHQADNLLPFISGFFYKEWSTESILYLASIMYFIDNFDNFINSKIDLGCLQFYLGQFWSNTWFYYYSSFHDFMYHGFLSSVVIKYISNVFFPSLLYPFPYGLFPLFFQLSTKEHFLYNYFFYPFMHVHYMCFTVFHIYMTYFIFLIESCVFCLHLFPLFLFNLVYSDSFLSIVCCSFYIRLRISAIIHFFLSFIPQDNLFCCCSLCLLLRHST